MMTMRASVARHVAAGIEGIDELMVLVAQDIGRVPSRNVLATTKRDTKDPAKQREKQREMDAHWRMANPVKRLLFACRHSAKYRGHECTLTAADIEAMLASMVCSVTGLPLSLVHDGDTRRNPWAPSLDRIDCSKGYVPGNVRIVCALYNIARNDFPDEALLVMAKALVAKTL